MKRLFYYEYKWQRNPGWWYFRIIADPALDINIRFMSELYRIGIFGFKIELTKLPF